MTKILSMLCGTHVGFHNAMVQCGADDPVWNFHSSMASSVSIEVLSSMERAVSVDEFVFLSSMRKSSPRQPLGVGAEPLSF